MCNQSLINVVEWSVLHTYGRDPYTLQSSQTDGCVSANMADRRTISIGGKNVIGASLQMSSSSGHV